MTRLGLFSLLLVTLACGDDARPRNDAALDGSDLADASDDAQIHDARIDGEIIADFGVGDPDMGIDAPSVLDASVDGNVDAGSDAGSDRDAGAFHVSPTQCVTSAECGGGSCEPSAPGGICNGCGAAAGSCPGATECGAFGACAEPCDEDGDCNAGMRCARSQCVLRRCSSTEMCGPYACTDGFCRRPTCDEAACPAPFMCADGLCIEP